MQTQALLQATNLEVGYGGRPLLPALTFSVAREQWWALVGRNGGGKTTLLRTMLGLLPRVGGAFGWTTGTRLGYVPQRSELDLSIPQRVCDVVGQGLDAGWSFAKPRPKTSSSRIEAALVEVGMGQLMKQPFSALSDGQRQRVLVARALVHEPDVLILDEPTNGMDLASELAAFELFATLQSTRHLALIIVTHHMSMLSTRATNVVWVDKDDRHAIAGPVDEVAAHPQFSSRYGEIFSSTTTPSRSAPSSTPSQGAA